MKPTVGIMAGLLLVLFIGAGIWSRQRDKDAEQQRSAALEDQVQKLETELAVTRATGPASDRQLTTITRLANAPILTSNTALAPAPPAASNAAMLQDPETRALMRKQMDRELAKLSDRIVTKDFARDWNLTPAQAAQVKDLVREKAVAGKEMLNAMLFDGLDDAALAQRGRETKQRLADADATLRGLLGQDGLDALKQQERMLEIRERIKRIREELATTDHPLTTAQLDSLIEAMSSERQAFSFRVDYEDPAKFDFEHIRDAFSDANLQIYFEDLQQLNARVAERGALFLSSAQLEVLNKFQQNQIEQARLTTRITTELFNRRRAN